MVLLLDILWRRALLAVRVVRRRGARPLVGAWQAVLLLVLRVLVGGHVRARDAASQTGEDQPMPTVKEQAEAWNMSERSVSMVRAIERIRPDLAEAAIAGRMSVHMAWQVANGRITAPDRSTTWTKLIFAWNRARPDERQRFLEMLDLGMID